MNHPPYLALWSSPFDCPWYVVLWQSSVYVDITNGETLYGSTANFASTCTSQAGSNHALVHLCSSLKDSSCTNTNRLTTGLCSTIETITMTAAEAAGLWSTAQGWKRLGLVSGSSFTAAKTYESSSGSEVTEEQVRISCEGAAAQRLPWAVALHDSRAHLSHVAPI